MSDTKGEKMKKGKIAAKVEKKILVIGIENEYEGHAPLYFDLKKPQQFADYVKFNIEREQQYTFHVSEMSPKEFAELE